MPKELNKVLHQPVRTRIMAHLSNVKKCDYSELKKNLSLSDGHMSTHMRELISNRYIKAEKKFVDNKPKTTYVLTKEGQKQFLAYVRSLMELITSS